MARDDEPRVRDVFLVPRGGAPKKLPSGAKAEGIRALTAENGLIPDTQERTLQKIGRDLFRRVIRNPRTFSQELRARRVSHPDHRTRLWFVLTNREQDAQTWELLCNPDGGPFDFMACDPYTPLVRTLKRPGERDLLLPIDGPLRVLAIVAQPKGLEPPGIQAEKKALRAAVADAKRMGLVDISWITGRNTIGQLKKALKKPWHIIHFIGHGDFNVKLGIGMLVFEDATGNAYEVRANVFTNLLAGKGTRLVVLNSCRGAFAGRGGLLTSTAARVAGSVPAVVSMQTSISDVAAVEFAREFYGALLQGVPVESAVTSGRVAVAAGGSAPGAIEWPAPVVYLSSAYDVLKLKTLKAHLDDDAPRAGRPRRTRKTKKSRARRRAELKAQVLLGGEKRPASPHDPQKNQWGGSPDANGRTLSATVKKLDKTWFEINLKVRSDRGAPALSKPVTFHLHSSFSEPLRVVKPEDGVATLRLVAYGAFTVGVEADDGKTRLELDLSQVDDAPRSFRQR
jgi:hypothetical protein